ACKFFVPGPPLSLFSANAYTDGTFFCVEIYSWGEHIAIERGLISFYDKTGIVDFARELASLSVEIVSTGGTAKLLREAGGEVRDVAELTGGPEMLGGRVKTLHPKVHGGILFQRSKPSDRAQVAEYKIEPIDLVVVNLYPFSATAATP